MSNIRNKIKAFKLRKQAHSLGEISDQLGIPKSTLSSWFKSEPWSAVVSAENHRRNFSPEKIIRLHEMRRKFFIDRSLRAKADAEKMFTVSRRQPLFAAGIALYLAGGDLSPKNNFVRLTSSDPRVIAVFRSFLDVYFQDGIPRLRLTVTIYPNLDEKRCLEWWSALAMVEKTKCLKTQMIAARSARKELLYGLATLTISSKFLKTKLLRLIELGSKEYSADIV